MITNKIDYKLYYLLYIKHLEMNCNITNPFNPSSMTSFKEYFTTFVTLPNIQLREGWGWFVDI